MGAFTIALSVQVPAPWELTHEAAPLASQPPEARSPFSPPAPQEALPDFVEQSPCELPVETVTVPLLHFKLIVADCAVLRLNNTAGILRNRNNDRRMMVSLA